MAGHPTSLDGSRAGRLHECKSGMPSSTVRHDVDLGDLANAVLRRMLATAPTLMPAGSTWWPPRVGPGGDYALA